MRTVTHMVALPGEDRVLQHREHQTGSFTSTSRAEPEPQPQGDPNQPLPHLPTVAGTQSTGTAALPAPLSPPGCVWPRCTGGAGGTHPPRRHSLFTFLLLLHGPGCAGAGARHALEGGQGGAPGQRCAELSRATPWPGSSGRDPSAGESLSRPALRLLCSAHSGRFPPPLAVPTNNHSVGLFPRTPGSFPLG